jgi:alkanesulfonate monooxygenase SsuD/methylene tetrahydromethanopterin reductase-like flavin-dependent oxidoreductase (luciferase family)
MAIPIGPLAPMLKAYREAWRNAGHPGEGEVMIAFHMFCHEDARLAREIARRPFEEYFRALNEGVSDWIQGTTSKDYQGYEKSMRKLAAFTLDGQIESGGAWVGTPTEIETIIQRVIKNFGEFEHASLQINFGTLNIADAQRSMCLFAAQVMPHFAPAERVDAAAHERLARAR